MTQQKKTTRCPIGMFTVGGRLKVQIAHHLLSGTRRFGELQRLIPEASRQMLTIQLRELEQMGVLHRQVYVQVPPKVEYSLTELGRSLEPTLRQLSVAFDMIVGASAESCTTQPAHSTGALLSSQPTLSS